MSNPATVLDPARAAHASIRGYLYQAWLGVERWLDLEADEVLRCEGDEDLDRLLRDGSGGWSEQVKALTGDLNIRDHVVQETLRRFAVSHHRLRTADPRDRRCFVFTSTAARRRQTAADGLEVDVLEVWEEAKTDKKVRAKVVKALQKLLPCAKPGKKEKGRIEFWLQLKSALAWLKSDPGHWADLIESIDWRLGEPELQQVRGRIVAKLRRIPSGTPPGIEHLLLSEVLDASVAPDPQDRCRTREQLDSLLRKTKADVARWLATDGYELVRRLEEVDRLAGLLQDKHRPLPSPPNQSHLLTALYEVIPFDTTGREEILESLRQWCDEGPNRRIRLIHGDGGLGKTRLLIEWCRQLAAQGWLTGFLIPTAKDAAMERLFEGVLPRLVVIDYAESRREQVRFLIDRLARFDDGPRIRVVLLARRAGDWWRDMHTDAETVELLEGSAAEQLPEVEERQRVFQRAAQAFASRLNKPLPKPLVIPALTEEKFGRPLYIHMAALGAVEGDPVKGAEEALTKTLEREQRYWHQVIQGTEVDEGARFELEEALPAAVTALTLVGGLEPTKKLWSLPGACCREPKTPGSSCSPIWWIDSIQLPPAPTATPEGWNPICSERSWSGTS